MCRPHHKSDGFCFVCSLLKIQFLWNSSDGQSSSTLWKYLKPLARLIKRCCKSSNTYWNTYIKLTAATTARRWWYPKINLFTKKWTKRALNEKVCFLLFSTSITFLLLPVTFKPYLIFETQFYQNCHTAKAPSIPENIFKIWKPIRKLVL